MVEEGMITFGSLGDFGNAAVLCVQDLTVVIFR